MCMSFAVHILFTCTREIVVNVSNCVVKFSCCAGVKMVGIVQ